MRSGVASVDVCRRLGALLSCSKKILKASDPDGEVRRPLQLLAPEKENGEQKIMQLCPSLRPWKGQILRGRPQAARGGQALRGDSHLASGQGCLLGSQPGFLASCTGLRSGRPTGASTFSALENTPGSQSPDLFPENFRISGGIRPRCLCFCSVRASPGSLSSPVDLYAPVTASLKWVFSEES